MESANNETSGVTRSAAYKGLVILGFASFYREGFEVVLFLQSIRLQVGSSNVLIIAQTGFAQSWCNAVNGFW